MGKVYEFMSGEHHEEYELLEQFKLSGSSEYFEKFVSGISRHMEFEEKILFQIVESHTGETVNPLLEEISLQHSRIRSLMQEISQMIKNPGSGENFDAPVSELEQLLNSHDSMEESDFYPWIDEYADPEEVKIMNAK
ncbi:hemerythrin domain-containing protein, partial [Candidatus Marsarchaeota archaeon]|nr:hemerythrin domain-containing protein [Candidatus Marsarchaeota archaeon]